MNHTKKTHTQYYDLDWNRHVTSRTYEKMALTSRMDILKKLGHPISKILENNWKWVSQKTQVRFHSQQFEDSEIEIATDVFRDAKGSLHFHHKLLDSTGKQVCTLGNQSVLLDENNFPVVLQEIHEDPYQEFRWSLDDRPENCNTLKRNLYIPFSDMNCFWNLPSDSVWKIFEEGRFLFFRELVDLNMITKFDTSTFFMGGEIEILQLPEPGSTILLHTWIDEIQKIRFFFRQDIVSQEGKLLAKMRDEQLFVSLSSSKPKKVPKEFLSSVELYIRENSSDI